MYAVEGNADCLYLLETTLFDGFEGTGAFRVGSIGGAQVRRPELGGVGSFTKTLAGTSSATGRFGDGRDGGRVV